MEYLSLLFRQGRWWWQILSQLGFRNPEGSIWECCFGKVSPLDHCLHQLLPSAYPCPVAPSATHTLRTGPVAEASTQISQVARRIPSGRRADSQITCLRSRIMGSGVSDGNVCSHVQVRAVQGCDKTWGCEAEGTGTCRGIVVTQPFPHSPEPWLLWSVPQAPPRLS